MADFNTVYEQLRAQGEPYNGSSQAHNDGRRIDVTDYVKNQTVLIGLNVAEVIGATLTAYTNPPRLVEEVEVRMGPPTRDRRTVATAIRSDRAVHYAGGIHSSFRVLRKDERLKQIDRIVGIGARALNLS